MATTTLSDLINGKAYVDYTQAIKSRKDRNVLGKGLQPFVDELKAQKTRRKDCHAAFEVMSFHPGIIKKTVMGEDGIGEEDRNTLMMTVEGRKPMAVSDRLIWQLARFSRETEGKSATIPAGYLKVLLDNSGDFEDVQMAATNLNHWFAKRGGETHSRKGKNHGAMRRLFVRALETDVDSGDFVLVGLASDSYMPLDSADIVASALGICGGAVKIEDGTGDNSAVDSIRVFDAMVSPYGVKLGLFNPGVAFDIRNPDQGIIRGTFERRNGSDSWVYPNGARYTPGEAYGRTGGLTGSGSDHLIFPACKISNDESGGGSAQVQFMIFEQACNNGMVLNKAIKRAHVSNLVTEANEYESLRTRKKKQSLIVSMMQDAVSQVFNVKDFEQNARAFLGLAQVAVANVEDCFSYVNEELGTESLLNDMLKAYEQFNPGQDTLLDVQRAITTVSQTQKEHVAESLEAFAGTIVERGSKALPKDLLVTA